MANLEARHLLLVSLGPVQDFIASARRCQDLWYGSWLLGQLSRAAADGIESLAGPGALVFPAKLRDDGPGASNKVLAEVPAGLDPAEVAERGRVAMSERLGELADAAFERVARPHFDEDLAHRQLADLMEYQWVSVPAADYDSARRQAERLLAARKNTRTWQAVPWPEGAGVPKSSLDGQRESVLHEDLYDAVGRTLTAEQLRQRYFVKPGERLCGVGLQKRVGTEVDFDDRRVRRTRPVFHSTSHVAAAPLLVRVARLGAQEAVARYLAGLRDAGVDVRRFEIACGAVGRIELTDPLDGGGPVAADRVFAPQGARGTDGYVLFEGRLNELAEEYCTGDGARGQVRGRAERLRGLQRGLFRELGLRRAPTPYYGLLLADGDRMGEAIDSLEEIGRHRDLADRVQQFAGGCDREVAEAGGSLIYAGGDDVMALVPLHTALDLAQRLRTRFAETLAGAFRDTERVPTLSVGLGIAHHLDPMSEALELARRAERLAKDHGRDALGIVASKRSGGELALAERWDDDLPGRLYGWCRRLRAEELPDGVAYELEEVLRPFEIGYDGEEVGKRVFDAVEALARRVVGRKRQQRGQEALDDGLAALLERRFSGGADPLEALRALSAELQLARLLLCAFDDAWGGRP